MKNINRFLYLLLAGISLSLSAQTETNLRFYHNFDDTLEAKYALGEKCFKGKTDPVFMDGVSGKAIKIGGTKEAQCSYSVPIKENLDFSTGSISLWVKPLDWDGKISRHFNIFIRAADDKNTMLVYKFFNSENMRFLNGFLNQDRSTFIDGLIRFWQKEQWHHVAVVWTTEDIQMYLDGKLTNSKKLRYPIEKSSCKGNLSIGPEGWNDGAEGSSLIDELKIFSTPLTQQEITKLYREFSSKIFNDENIITLGREAGKNKYTFSGIGWHNDSGLRVDESGKWHLGSDGKKIYVRVQNPKEPVEVLLYVDGKLIRTPLSADGEAAIPFDGKDIRLNITCLKSGLNLAPVAGFAEDIANFFYLRFVDNVPLLAINSLWDIEEARFSVNAEAEGSGDDLIELAYFVDNKLEYGQISRNCILFEKGKKVPGLKRFYELSEPTEVYYSLQVKNSKNESEKVLFRVNWRKNFSPPAKVMFLYTKLASKELSLSLELNKPAGNLRLRFLDAKGEIAQDNILPLPVNSKYHEALVPLNLEKLLPGNYLVKIDHVLPEGNIVYTFEQEYQIPGPDSNVLKPYKSRVTEVPKPWTPLKTSETSAEMWGRKYDFADGFLASKLSSLGKELLSEPIYISIDDKKLTAVTKPILRLISKDEMKSVWEKETDLGLLKIKALFTVHFDGYCDVELQLIGPVRINKLALNVPLKKEFATLVRDNHIGQGAPYKGKSGAVGDYWYNNLDDGYSVFIRVGNESVGFNWFAPDLFDWHCPKEHKVEIKDGLLSFNYSDDNWYITPDKPHIVKFGFTLTPTRPVSEGLRAKRFGRDVSYFIQAWEHFNYPDKDRVRMEEIDRLTKDSKEGFLYYSRFFIGPYAPEWGYWQEEWLPRNMPLGSRIGKDYQDVKIRDRVTYTVVRPAATYHNFWLNQFSTFVDNMPVHPKAIHYYFDYCLDSDYDNQGRRFTCFDSTRRLGMEVYAMTRKNNPDSMIMYHTSYQRLMPLQHFADYFLEGEGFESTIARNNGGYYDYFTPDYFRSTFLTETWGISVIVLPQMYLALAMFNPAMAVQFDANKPVFRKAILHFYGYVLVHDAGMLYDRQGRFKPIIDPLIEKQDEFGWDDKVKFHPYWKPEEGVKQLTPGLERIMASAFTRNGGLMLAVLNDTDKEQDVEIALDLKKLGAKAGLKGKDIWDLKEEWTLGDKWAGKIPARGFRLIVFLP